MAAKSKNVIEVQYRIKGIELVKSQINPVHPGFSANEFQFTVNLEIMVDPETKSVFIRVFVDIRSDNKPELLGSFGAAVAFAIENFNDIFKKKSDNTFHSPDEVIVNFFSISISTLRGIIFDQLRGTHLHNAILPVLDPKQFRQGK